MQIRNLDGTQAVFSNFTVKSDSGMVYQVELRDVTTRMFSCTCADFRKNGLGTCKHVEAVLIYAAKKAGKTGWAKALELGSPRIEVMAHAQYGLQVWRGLELLPKAVRGMFDVHDGTLLSRVPPEEAMVALTRLQSADFPQLRIAQEVTVWLEAREAAHTA